MKIVIASIENKKVKLEEVEFDGRIAGLCKLLELYEYQDFEEGERGEGFVSASDLTIYKEHCKVNRGTSLLPCAMYKINEIYNHEGDIIAFFGIENIVENKAPLTLKYLESTLVFPTEDNPEML
jgi:hypothetical protein